MPAARACSLPTLGILFQSRTAANNATRRLVPVEGIEPPCLAARDFESRASTSSATRATGYLYRQVAHGANRTPRSDSNAVHRQSMIRKSGFPVFRKDHAPTGNQTLNRSNFDRIRV